MKILFRHTVFPGRFVKGKGSPLRVRKFPFASSVTRVGPEWDGFDVDEELEDEDTMTVSEIEALLDETSKTIEELEALLVLYLGEK